MVSYDGLVMQGELSPIALVLNLLKVLEKAKVLLAQQKPEPMVLIFQPRDLEKKYTRQSGWVGWILRFGARSLLVRYVSVSTSNTVTRIL